MGGELYSRYAAARSTINLAHGLNGVSFGRHFIGPIALHACESPRKPTYDPALFTSTYDWMKARGLTEGGSDHGALVG